MIALNESAKSDGLPMSSRSAGTRTMAIFVLVVFVVAVFELEEIQIHLIHPLQSNFKSQLLGASSRSTLRSVENDSETVTAEAKTAPLSIKEWPMNLPDLPDTFRNDTQHRISSIYSTEALSQIDRIKAKLFRGDPVTVVMNGASSSAGGGDIPYDDRFFNQMVKRLEHDYPKANITTVDASHGGRTTLHSAHLMHAFFPPDMDIVIWEFSINDSWKSRRTIGYTDGDVRNHLIQWLRNLESMQKDPPLVIMVYLWQTPFSQNEDGTIANRNFIQHDFLPAEYDFVLGHVNLASYFDSLEWDFERLIKTFLADRHHPNILAHHILGDLVYQLISYAKSIPPLHKGTIAATNRTALKWMCRGNPKRTRPIKRLFSVTGGVAQGSYTPDLPHYEPEDTSRHRSTPGTLFPEGNVTLENFGKINPIRHDRQLGIILPCCSNDATSSASITFDLGKELYVHAIEFKLRVRRERKSDIRIIYDGMHELNSVSTKIIRPRDWKCVLGDDFVMVRRNVSTLAFCDSKCNVTQPFPLVAITIF